MYRQSDLTRAYAIPTRIGLEKSRIFMPSELRDPRGSSPADANPPQARPFLAHSVPVRVDDVQIHKALVRSDGEEPAVRGELDLRDAFRAMLGAAVLLQARVEVE